MNSQYQEKIEKYHKRESAVRKVSIFTAIIPIIIGTLWMFFSFNEVQELKGEKIALQDTLGEINSELQSLQFEVSALSEKKLNLEKELMETYGLSIDSINNMSTTEILEVSLQANESLKDLSKGYRPAKNITVRYYNKTIDEEKIALSLKSLGYNFDSKTPTSYMSKQGTNSVWFGSNVALKDVKIVALTLIRAGAPIKAIRPFNNSLNNPSYKSNIIEVGADKGITDKDKLTVREVEEAEEFVRF